MKTNITSIICCLLLLFSTCKKEEWVFDSPANENLELPLLLNINEKPCALDIDTRTFRFPIEQASIADFTALVEFQDYSSVKFNGIELSNGSINNLGDIQINTAYEIVFTTDGEKNTFQLYFSLLPIVQLVAHDKIKNEPKSFARLILNNTATNKASENSLIGVEYRGVSSLRNPKKSMGFKLIQDFDMDEEYALSFFNKTASTSWVLDAMYIDKAKGRNKTTLELWQTLPNDVEHIGTSCEYVEVFLNYESLGLYSFCESLTYDFLGLNPQSVLITGKNNAPHTYFETLPNKSPTGPYWGFWEQKIPDADLGNDWAAFKDLCKLAVNGSDQQFVDEIEQHIDLDVLIDYFLYVNIAQASDDVGKNWFFLKKSPSHRFTIVPWDLDSSWGRNHTSAETGNQSAVSNSLFERLIALNPNGYKQRLKDRWNTLKNNELSKSNLIALFDANFSELNQTNIIEIENTTWNRNINLQDEQLFVNNWIDEKWDFTDYYINNL